METAQDLSTPRVAASASNAPVAVNLTAAAQQGTSSTAAPSAAVTAGSAGDKPKPKKPMNAFLLFCKHHRALVKEKYPTLENRMITKILGEWWNELKGTEDQATYKNLASRHQDFLRMQEAEKLQQLQRAAANTLAAQQPATAAVTAAAAKLVQHQHVLAAPVTAAPTAAPSTQQHQLHQPQSGASSPEDQPSSPALHAHQPTSTGLKRPAPAAGGSESAQSGGGAPKHFKKRFLEAAAKMNSDENSPSSSGPSSPPSGVLTAGNETAGTGSSTVTVSRASPVSTSAVSNPEEKACEALLQLAGGGSRLVVGQVPSSVHPVGSAIVNGGLASQNGIPTSRSASNSRSGTSSPKDLVMDERATPIAAVSPAVSLTSLPEPGSIQSETGKRYPMVRTAVWNKIAKTLKHQTTEDERSKMKAMANGASDGLPINLTTSTMTKLHTTTIIEHVIENIMDKPLHPDKHLNNNAILQMDMVNGATTNGLGGGPGGGPGGHNNATNGVSNGDLGDEDKTKENILESLRKAAKNNSASKLKLTPDQWKGIPTNRFHSGSVSQPAPQALAAAPAAPVVTPTAVVVAAPPPASVVQIANAPPLQAEPTPVAIQLPQQPISRPSPPAVAALTAPSAVDATQPLVLKTSLNIGGNSLTVTKIKDSSVAGESSSSGGGDQPLNLSTTPPQTPGLSAALSPVSAGLSDSQSDDHKQQRACKGRRYQEFKDAAVGRKGRRQKSGGGHHSESEASNPASSHAAAAVTVTSASASAAAAAALIQPLINTQQLTIIPAPPSATSTVSTVMLTSQPQPSLAVFDVNKELQNMPVLNYEAYAQKKKAAASSAHGPTHPSHHGGGPNQLATTVAAGPTVATPTTVVVGGYSVPLTSGGTLPTLEVNRLHHGPASGAMTFSKVAAARPVSVVHAVQAALPGQAALQQVSTVVAGPSAAGTPVIVTAGRTDS